MNEAIQRADAATDAGSNFARALTDRSHHACKFCGLGHTSALGGIADLQDIHQRAAEADPAAFVKAFFEAIDMAISDFHYDQRNK